MHVMGLAEVFHGIASCVALLYIWNLKRHCEAAEAISWQNINNVHEQ